MSLNYEMVPIAKSTLSPYPHLRVPISHSVVDKSSRVVDRFENMMGLSWNCSPVQTVTTKTSMFRRLLRGSVFLLNFWENFYWECR